MKASNTIAQSATIAVEIQHDRFFSVRRYVPDDHPFAVLGIERDLLGFREAGHSRRCMQSLREIHQRALRHIHQRDESTECGSAYNEPFEQRHGSFNSMQTRASKYEPNAPCADVFTGRR